MKLLHCLACEDIRSLVLNDWVTCRCGKSRGRYVDPLHAVIEEIRKLEGLATAHCVMSTFIGVVLRDKVDIQAAHREFLKIANYRDAIPEDVVWELPDRPRLPIVSFAPTSAYLAVKAPQPAQCDRKDVLLRATMDILDKWAIRDYLACIPWRCGRCPELKLRTTIIISPLQTE